MNKETTMFARWLLLFLIASVSVRSMGATGADTVRRIRIEWKQAQPMGKIHVDNGHVQKLFITKGAGKINQENYQFRSVNHNALVIEIANFNDNPGPAPTTVTVDDQSNAFSFFLRDVTAEYPIFIPDYGVAVLNADDHRAYAEIEKEIVSRKLTTKIQRITAAPEETSFEAVEDRVRDMSVPTWLGISRDFRFFEIAESLSDATHGEANIISPKFSATPLLLPETENNPVNYLYTVGRGIGVQDNISRRLEQGVLPILHSTLKDDDIRYESITFTSLEKSSLSAETPIGTDFLVADSYSGGHMFTEEQRKVLDVKREEALNPEEETVLYFRSEAINTGAVPRYAWFKAPRPGVGWHQRRDYTFNPSTGFSNYASGRVFCISRLNGEPLQNEEIAVLLQPNEKAVFEFLVPHSPVSEDRAAELKKQSYQQRYEETKEFWENKLQRAARIRLPEKRIEEMIQAGLLHLDLVTYGKEPDGTLAPNIGVYSPIGTESAPIIQFYNSMGRQEIAKRSLAYFLDKQHDDGFIQNFGGYMVETGAALWTMGEYFRYTADKEWARQSAAKLLKSCDYLIAWRNRNKKEELRGRGYGMIEGKVADPEDHFHQFMLNGYGYIGLSRVAEILAAIGSDEADRIRKEAAAWRSDIRESFFNVMALSSVVPLGDGTWCPTAPPWTEATGLRALYMKPEAFWSHGTVTVSDAMLGPLYLVFCEVLDVDEPAAKMLLKYNSELFYQGNAAFSQPYYSRHNWMQAKLGMTKPFLETYYSTFAALADRETYTFWEHLYKLTPHKTHEEGWFLMETRWMLYQEVGDTLNLFKTIPRKWMENGGTIELGGVQSYFGKLNVKVTSHVESGFIEASVESDASRKPNVVTIRLPHPELKEPISVEGGVYDRETETVTISSFTGKSTVVIQY